MCFLSLNAALYCADFGDGDLRECLNRHIGQRVFSHDCLQVLLPRGFIDLQLDNIRDLGEAPLLTTTSTLLSLVQLHALKLKSLCRSLSSASLSTACCA
jgi:hypothetical protein